MAQLQQQDLLCWETPAPPLLIQRLLICRVPARAGHFVMSIPDHLEWRFQVHQGSSITPSSVGAIPECSTAAFLHITSSNQVTSPWSFGWKIRCETKLSTVYVHNSLCIWIRACPWHLLCCIWFSLCACDSFLIRFYCSPWHSELWLGSSFSAAALVWPRTAQPYPAQPELIHNKLCQITALVLKN